tara:strand:+ start:345 stop:512 length:168 start_codon:yes stop_codon:yes gene_type:complete
MDFAPRLPVGRFQSFGDVRIIESSSPVELGFDIAGFQPYLSEKAYMQFFKIEKGN